VLLYVANPGEVTRLAGFLFGNILRINVSAAMTGSATATWQIPDDIELFHVVSWMHSHGTNFVATINGQPLYENTQWDAPTPSVFDPALAIRAGSTLAWTCSYDNTAGASALTFGGSIKNNEMCSIEGRAITPNGDPLTRQAL
jgi:hypothetical protein